MKVRALLVALTALATACGGTALTRRDPTFAHTSGGEIDWNPSHVDVGRVVAVADQGEEVGVFTETGSHVFASGSLVASERSQVSWLSAGTVPATGGAGRWMVAVDQKGELWRLRDRQHLERVGDRFGLAKAKVLGAFAAGTEAAPLAVFLLDGQIAVADGREVRFVASRARGGDAGGGVIALRDDDGVTRLGADLRAAVNYPLKSAGDVAIDGRGRIFAATPRGVYAEGSGNTLTLVYRATAGSIHGLVASGARIWIAEGGSLAAIDTGAGDKVTLLDATIPDGARLAGSPGGDVWVIDGGRLSRYGVAAAATRAPAWDTAVRPVFLRVCAGCHKAGGSSGIDLGSEAAWRARSPVIRDRVLTHRTMPPAGAPSSLSVADREALRDWLGR